MTYNRAAKLHCFSINMGSQKDLPAATRPRVLDVALADAAAAEGGAAGGPLGALEAACLAHAAVLWSPPEPVARRGGGPP